MIRLVTDRMGWTKTARRIQSLAAALIVLGACTDCTGASSSSSQRAAAVEPPEGRKRPAAPPAPAPDEASALQSPVSERPSAVPYALGELPDGFGGVSWPTLPRIEHELEVSGGEAIVDGPMTRVIVRGDVERIVVRADDIEIRGSPNARVEHVLIERSRRRIRIDGGRFGAIELHVPAQHVPPPPRWRPEWLVEDVTIENVDVESADTAFLLRGKRIAILRSRVRAERYSVWCGDTDTFQSEDLVLAGNRFESAGPESTVRLVSVRRALVIDNVISNTIKHDFRVHGVSDDVVFARNRLLNTGIMVGSMEGDRIGSVWILDNSLHHRVPSLFEVEPSRVHRLVVRGNRVFSDRWNCFFCSRPARGWIIDDNPVAPYRPPSD